jgi:hypothetical protein
LILNKIKFFQQHLTNEPNIEPITDSQRGRSETLDNRSEHTVNNASNIAGNIASLLKIVIVTDIIYYYIKILFISYKWS